MHYLFLHRATEVLDPEKRMQLEMCGDEAMIERTRTSALFVSAEAEAANAIPASTNLVQKSVP